MLSSNAYDFPLDVRHCFKTSSLLFHFQFGKQSKITGGWVQWVRKMGSDNHVVVSHKLCDFQRHVDGCIFVMKEPVVVPRKFRLFLPHIFSQVSQKVTVKVRADCSVRRNKFTVNNPLHIKKKNEHALCRTPDLPHLSCSWWLQALPPRRLLFCF
jgi:hypothetical protein